MQIIGRVSSKYGMWKGKLVLHDNSSCCKCQISSSRISSNHDFLWVNVEVFADAFYKKFIDSKAVIGSSREDVLRRQSVIDRKNRDIQID